MSRIFEALRQAETQGHALGMEGGPTPVLAGGGPGTQADLEAVAQVEANPDGKLLALEGETTLGAEKFRVLATRLVHLRHSRKLKVLHVTSASIGDGKTLVAINLAFTLAHLADSRVLLIDGDLRKPNIDDMLGVTAGRGLAGWYQDGKATIESYLRRIPRLPLWILSAGKTEDAAAVLQSPRVAQLLARFETWFDWVVIDSPPLVPLADANLWSRLADGSLLVVREGLTPKRALEKGLDSLDNPKLVGIVLNDAKDFDALKYPGYYYAHYGTGQSGNHRSKGEGAK